MNNCNENDFPKLWEHPASGVLASCCMLAKLVGTPTFVGVRNCVTLLMQL